MIITIRTTGGPVGTDEVLGRIDTGQLELGTRQRLATQLEALADLASSHEPSAAEGIRYEVEVQGPGHSSNFLVVEETADPEHPLARALAALLQTLDIPPKVVSPAR